MDWVCDCNLPYMILDLLGLQVDEDSGKVVLDVFVFSYLWTCVPWSVR